MYIIFIHAHEFLKTNSDRTSIAREELISAALGAGVCISGLSGIDLPLGITLSGIAAVYIVMCIAYHCSLSAAGSAGLGIGFICSMSSVSAVSSAGFYGICSLFGSLLKGLGKFGAAVGFLGGAAASLIYSQFGGNLAINAIDVVIGASVFTLTPEKLHCRINSFFSKTSPGNSSASGDRTRIYIFKKLKNMSDAFLTLNSGIYALSEKRLKNLSYEASDLFEETASRVCRGCSMAVGCWERDFNSAYKRMLTLLDIIESDGEITELPRSFSDNCIRSSLFVNEFSHVYEIFRNRELFTGEAVRGRDIAAGQYRCISDMLLSVASSIERGISFRSEYEDALITELDKNGITLFEISVIETGENSFEIYLGLSSGAYVEKLEQIIFEVTGCKTELESESGGVVKFVTAPKYTTELGVCSVPCSGCSVSGDSTEIFETADHRSFVIISDGMGTGRSACSESESIVRLLKDFINAGFDTETAIKTINSALCLQLDNERAAAVDILCIDRADGFAKMFKIGCAETIVANEHGFDTIFPVSLPAGIIDEINMKPQTRRVHDGDIFIMATDGITQCGGLFSEWVKGDIDIEDSAEEISRRIVHHAVEKWGGAAFDDMTCVVVKVSG
jgi:stage II sporulation protein E